MLSTMGGGGGVKKWWKTVHVVYGWPQMKNLEQFVGIKFNELFSNVQYWNFYSSVEAWKL